MRNRFCTTGRRGVCGARTFLVAGPSRCDIVRQLSDTSIRPEERPCEIASALQAVEVFAEREHFWLRVRRAVISCAKYPTQVLDPRSGHEKSLLQES